MKTKTIKIYKLNELDERIQEKAYAEWLQKYYMYGWTSENQQTLEKFADIFPVKVRRRNDGFEMTFDDNLESLSGWKLARYIWNNYRKQIYKPKQYWICNGHKNAVGVNAKHRDSKVSIYEEGMCPLTGFHIDNYILDPIYKFMKKPDNSTFEDLMNDCYNEWDKAVRRDEEDSQSLRAFKDDCEANEFWFNNDGEFEQPE